MSDQERTVAPGQLASRPGHDQPRPGSTQADDAEAVLKALQWSGVTGWTGLRPGDLHAAALKAAGPRAAAARESLDKAAASLLACSWKEADRHLQQALSAASDAGSPAVPLIFQLRKRLIEATAVDRAGTAIRRFDRVISTWGTAGIVEKVVSDIGDREAVVYPLDRHLSLAGISRIPRRELTVIGRGADPVTPSAARQYARYLPAGMPLSEAGREELAEAIRLGRTPAGPALRQAIQYHRQYHQQRVNGVPPGPIRGCDQVPCRQALADWRARTDQSTGSRTARKAVRRRPRTAAAGRTTARRSR
jgi:hypothetical protein